MEVPITHISSKIGSIDASNANGIDIENTNACVIIQNCKITNGLNTNFDGIYFSNVTNGVIMNNNASSNQDGIHLFDSENNTLINNTANTNYLFGIYLDGSNNNTIINNVASSNLGNFQVYGWIDGNGFKLSGSNNNIITNNTLLADRIYGLDLDS